MVSLEQQYYTDSYKEGEIPTYGSNIQQLLQNLPPPLTDEPSFLDSSQQVVNHYEMQPSNSVILMDNYDLSSPPPYEQSTILDDSLIDNSPNQMYSNNNLKTETYVDNSQQNNGYPVIEVEDKIKDILARYNPQASVNNLPKQENSEIFKGNQIFEAPPPQIQPVSRQPPQQQLNRQNPNVPPLQYQSPPPQNKVAQYSSSPSYSQPQVINANPQQPQLRARVVQNVPANNPSVQSFNNQRIQANPSQVVQNTQPTQHTSNSSHLQTPQMIQQTPSVSSVHQQTPPVQQSSQVYQPQVQVPQFTQSTSVPQSESGYLQLVQQQNIQFQLQNQQIQSLQNTQNQQTKELLDKMQGYFEKISNFMERSEKRLNNIEQTSLAILKKSNNEEFTSFSRNEIDSVKKLQDQMESDFDIAKRLQAEIDSKYNKEKKEERKKEKKEKRKESKSSSSSSSSSMQECPICTLKVPFSDLELHVNQCLENIEKTGGDSKENTQEKVSFWKRVFGPGPKKTTDEKDSKSNMTPPQRPALPAPPSSSSTQQPSLYPTGPDFYQMPFVYRGGYPQPQMVSPQMVSPQMVSPQMVSPQMVSPQMYPYPGQQIYYIPSNGMGQTQTTQGAKK